MIFAELMGKLGTNASRVHERSEDLLTSTVFGLLRYVRAGAGVLDVLLTAREATIIDGRFAVSSLQPWLLRAEGNSAHLEFWPSWGEYGQPDLLVRLADSNGLSVGAVLVEIKLYSPKSGAADADADAISDEAVPDPDQLVKYWQGLKRHFPCDQSLALIYLTAHSSPPAHELNEALRRMPGMRLGWLSWYDVHRSIAEIARVDGDLVAKDLALLLAHKGLAHFSGFSSLSPPVIPRLSFWRLRRSAAAGRDSAKWFQHCAPTLPLVQRVWRSS